MKSESEKIKITVFVEEEVWKNLQLNNIPGRIRNIPKIIRRDELLNLWLESALEDLKDRPVNTLENSIYEHYVYAFIPKKRKKINLTLNRDVLTKLDEILKEKNVTRTFFLAVFLSSLDCAVSALEHALNSPFEASFYDGPMYREIFPTENQADAFKVKYESFFGKESEPLTNKEQNELLEALKPLNKEETKDV